MTTPAPPPPPPERPDDDLLPDVTSDERAIGWGDDFGDDEGTDARLLDDRPPHWDGD